MTIQLLDSTMDVGVNAPPDKERIVALIRNEGEHTTAMFSLKPSTEAQYFVRLKKGTAGSEAKWRMVEFGIEEGKVNENYQRGKVETCDDQNHGKSEIGFKDCPTPPGTASSTKRMSMLDALLAPFSLLTRNSLGAAQDTTRLPPDDPLWISCNTGCCTLRLTQ